MGKRTIKTNSHLILYEKFKQNQNSSLKREDLLTKKSIPCKDYRKENRIKKYIKDGVPITIAIASLYSGSGCTFLCNAFKEYLISLNYSVIKIDRDNFDVNEDKVYNFIIFDAGKCANTSKMLERSMIQAHIKILVCLSSDTYLKDLSQFIKMNANPKQWKFIFNKVLKYEYKRLSDLMEDYEYYIVPAFSTGDQTIEKELWNSFQAILLKNV